MTTKILGIRGTNGNRITEHYRPAFGKCSIWIPACLDEGFRDFPQALQANARTVPHQAMTASFQILSKSSIILPLEAGASQNQLQKQRRKRQRIPWKLLNYEHEKRKKENNRRPSNWKDQHIQIEIRRGQRDKSLILMMMTDAQIVTRKQKQILNFSTASSIRKIKNTWYNNMHCFQIERLQPKYKCYAKLGCGSVRHVILQLLETPC